ncbi:MAG TPA: response regulator transcription factor [Burkholderiales bacterium]|nr:response regulator transcription factor [Burkholderiales bacterium]
MKIKVLIADDHGVVAEGLRSLIEAQADMEVVALAVDGHEAVRRATETRPDVVLMDIGMPVLNGTEATRIIRERGTQTRVIMLSAYSDPVHVYRAFQAGATGYIAKKSVAKEVVDAIRMAHEGRHYLSRHLTAGLTDHVVHKAASGDPLQRLSSRERQVLQMLAEGHPVAKIAGTLSLSPKSVETYRARMMDKLGIHDLASLVKFAIQQGVTPLE